MENPQDLIAKRIQELPQYVRDAIAEAQATVKLRDIGSKHHLRIDQQAVMEREVMLVMLGFTDEASFVRNLRNEAHITEEGAQNLAQDVGREIFSHIRIAMQRMQAEGAAQPVAPANAAEPVKAAVLAPQARAVEKDAHLSLMPVEMALKEERISPPTKVDVGLAPSKPGYKSDPYLEPIE